MKLWSKEVLVAGALLGVGMSALACDPPRYYGGPVYSGPGIPCGPSYSGSYGSSRSYPVGGSYPIGGSYPVGSSYGSSTLVGRSYGPSYTYQSGPAYQVGPTVTYYGSPPPVTYIGPGYGYSGYQSASSVPLASPRYVETLGKQEWIYGSGAMGQGFYYGRRTPEGVFMADPESFRTSEPPGYVDAKPVSRPSGMPVTPTTRPNSDDLKTLPKRPEKDGNDTPFPAPLPPKK